MLRSAPRGFVERLGVRSIAPTPTITENGLVLGATVLAPMCRAPGENPQIALRGYETRILALLAVAYGASVRPCALRNIRRAEQYWRNGQRSLAEIELALTRLPPLRGDVEVSRLQVADELLARGVNPREVIKVCGLDPNRFGFEKEGYNPDQPRVPRRQSRRRPVD